MEKPVKANAVSVQKLRSFLKKLRIGKRNNAVSPSNTPGTLSDIGEVSGSTTPGYTSGSVSDVSSIHSSGTVTPTRPAMTIAEAQARFNADFPSKRCRVIQRFNEEGRPMSPIPRHLIIADILLLDFLYQLERGVLVWFPENATVETNVMIHCWDLKPAKTKTKNKRGLTRRERFEARNFHIGGEPLYRVARPIDREAAWYIPTGAVEFRDSFTDADVRQSLSNFCKLVLRGEDNVPVGNETAARIALEGIFSADPLTYNLLHAIYQFAKADRFDPDGLRDKLLEIFDSAEIDLVGGSRYTQPLPEA